MGEEEIDSSFESTFHVRMTGVFRAFLNGFVTSTGKITPFISFSRKKTCSRTALDHEVLESVKITNEEYIDSLQIERDTKEFKSCDQNTPLMLS